MATFRKRDNGNIQVQVRLAGCEHKSATFRTMREAQTWARKTEAHQDALRPADSQEEANERALKVLTVSDALARYAQEVSSNKKGAAIEMQKIARLQKSELAPHLLKDLNSTHILAWKKRREKNDGVSSATILREWSILRHLFNYARTEWKLKIENPFSKLTKPKKSRGRDRRLFPGEEEKLLEVTAEGPWYLQPLFILALETAMRRGELLQIEWADVDFDRRTISVQAAYTKTDEKRTIPLTRRATATLMGLKRSREPRVFPVSANAVKLAWDRARKKAGSPDLRLHDLRHEATSRLVEARFTDMEVCLITGHKSLEMLKRYTHLRAGDLVSHLDAIAEAA